MTIAQAILDGREDVLTRIASEPLKARADNFVARPWGGLKLRDYKHLGGEAGEESPARLGEAFELAACDADAEARTYPSVIRFGDA